MDEPRGRVEALRFGLFEVEPQSGDLRKAGRRLRLQEQPLRILLRLLERPGELVAREDLAAHLWPAGSPVDTKHGVDAAVRRLREVLGDTAREATFVETVPGRGYRFIARVDRSPGTDLPHERPSVAVLPFLDLSANAPAPELADALTEDLIAELAKLSGLKVISRTSVMRFRKPRRASLGDIAAALGVRHVVEGSVRTHGDVLRIVVQLIDAASDDHVWTETRDCALTETYAIEREFAVAIANRIGAPISPRERARAGRVGTHSSAAFRFAALARHSCLRFTEEGIQRGIGFYERAIAEDARFAAAHAGLGWAYIVLGFGHGAGALRPREAYGRARECLHAALAIDPASAEAHAFLGMLQFSFEYDWQGAEESFRLALALDPGLAEAYGAFGLMLAALGRYDEALAVQRQAHELDPLAPVLLSDIASTLLRAGRWEDALEQAHEVLRLEPAFPMAHSTAAWALIHQGRHVEGLQALEQAVSLSPDNTLFVAQLAQAWAMTGAVAKARDVLDRLDHLAVERYVSPYHLAYIYTGLGDTERAIDCLEQAVEERAGGVYGIRGSFLFTPLRGHPRFASLLRRMNL